ncbi:hypothetical protein TthSNM33_07750 [Thermus thermophilus]|nr:hypothetical protein TthSNM17_07810 [Thermus thermophilus]BDG23581.1 hypothetical protein TthSNM33_07750 [Thermus thermophilus]BDG26678.1 hypothetical protein TthSNM66_13140 [Thermus thermophilus]
MRTSFATAAGGGVAPATPGPVGPAREAQGVYPGSEARPSYQNRSQGRKPRESALPGLGTPPPVRASQGTGAKGA